MSKLALIGCAALLLLPALAISAASGGINLSTPSSPARSPTSRPTTCSSTSRPGSPSTIPWELLAAVGKVECDHGRHPHPACRRQGVDNYAGAGGPMQFLAAHLGRATGSTPTRTGSPTAGTRPTRSSPPPTTSPPPAPPTTSKPRSTPTTPPAAYVAEVLAWAEHYQRSRRRGRRASRSTSARCPDRATGPRSPQAVLSNPNIELRPEAEADVRAGRVDPRVLAALLALAERFSLAGVGPFVSGHSYYVAGTNRPSNHAFGRAVDIGTINGELVSPANGAARQAALALASLPAPLRPDEIGSPFAELEQPARPLQRRRPPGPPPPRLRPMTQQNESPLVRYLRDPSLLLARRARTRPRGARASLSTLAPIAVAIAARARPCPRWCSAALRERRLAEGARLIAIGVPPEVEPEGRCCSGRRCTTCSAPGSPASSPGSRSWPGRSRPAAVAASSGSGSRARCRPAWSSARSPPPGPASRPALPAGRTRAESGEDADGAARPARARCWRRASWCSRGSEWFPLGGTRRPRSAAARARPARRPRRGRARARAGRRPPGDRARAAAAARRRRGGSGPASRRCRIGRLLDLVLPGPPARPALDPTVSPDVRAVLEKASHPLYRCLVRVAVATLKGECARPDPRARRRLRRLRGPGRPAPPPQLRARAGSCELRALGRRGYLLSIPELAALAHLPGEARAARARARGRPQRRSAPRPAHERQAARRSAAGGEPVALAVADARYHLHLLGPTGVGKSTLIARLALADLEAGRGAVVIDPKGDLVEEILERIPAGLDDRVDLLDPLDPAPPGLNVLEGADHDLVVDQLVGIFRRVYEHFWGPRTDDILRAALLTLLARGRAATLADVPRLLSDERWREQLLLEFEDPVGLEPFWEWYERARRGGAGAGDRAGAEQAARLPAPPPGARDRRPGALDDRRRRHASTRAACCSSGCRKGRSARTPAGCSAPSSSPASGRQRSPAPAAPRRSGPTAPSTSTRCTTTSTCPPRSDEMLAEARGYHLSLCLAHQHLAQLPKEMREAIAANARSKLYFQLSPHGRASARARGRARAGSARPRPPAPPRAAVRLCQAGETGPAFTLTTQPLPARRSRAGGGGARGRRGARNGREREQVEALLADRQTRPGREQPREPHRRRRLSRRRSAGVRSGVRCGIRSGVRSGPDPPRAAQIASTGRRFPRRWSSTRQGGESRDPLRGSCRARRRRGCGRARLAPDRARPAGRARLLRAPRAHDRAAAPAPLRLSPPRPLAARAACTSCACSTASGHPGERGQGSAPFHWLLDEAGAHVVAEALGLERSELRWRHQAAIAIASSSKLAHQLEVNEFFTRLAEEAARPAAGSPPGGASGAASPPSAARQPPTATAASSCPASGRLSFLLELDRGTEDQPSGCAQKARRYARALPRSQLAPEAPLILLAVPTPARRDNLAQARSPPAAPRSASSSGRRSAPRSRRSPTRSRRARPQAAALAVPRSPNPTTRPLRLLRRPRMPDHTHTENS